MKVKFLLLLLLGWVGVAQGQITEGIEKNAREMGLVAYLTQLKYKSEFQMSKIVNEKQIEDVMKLEKVKTYNLLKTNVDMLINQMSADLYQKNRLRLYKRANKYIKNEQENFPDKYKSYENCLKRIDLLSTLLLSDKKEKEKEKEKETNGNPKSTTGTNGFFDIALASDWASVGTLAFEAIKMEQENRQKKVANIITILNQLRLKSISEFKEETKNGK